MRNFATVNDVFELLTSRGETAYFGEPVTVLEHSLQTAWLAQQHKGDNALIVAALLHDLGHLVEDTDEDARGVDMHHEELASQALAPHLPAAVLDPVFLHVTAKRFLCFSDPNYFSCLSPTSVQTLALQGGAMTAEQAEEFLALPHAQNAIALRRFDDAAKVPGLTVPGLENYRSLVSSFWR